MVTNETVMGHINMDKEEFRLLCLKITEGMKAIQDEKGGTSQADLVNEIVKHTDNMKAGIVAALFISDQLWGEKKAVQFITRMLKKGL